MTTEGDKNVKPVAESKKPASEVKKAEPDGKKPAVEAKKAEPEGKKPAAEAKPAAAREASAAAEEPAPREEPSLGKIIATARERRGLSQDDAAKDAHIPPHYLRMIESDDYSSISDQLYLLPFLRRYAIFVGLDPEGVASRFVRDVQHADMNATRMSEPIRMIEPGNNSTTVRIVIIAALAVAVLALGWFGFRRFYRPHKIASAIVQPERAPADNLLAS